MEKVNNNNVDNINVDNLCIIIYQLLKNFLNRNQFISEVPTHILERCLFLLEKQINKQ